VREIFDSLVSAVSSDHFVVADRPLLVEYARAAHQADVAAAQLAAVGAVTLEGRPSPWIVVQEKSVRALVARSARLRLCPQSRFDRLAAGTSARKGMPEVDPEDDPYGLLAGPVDSLARYGLSGTKGGKR